MRGMLEGIINLTLLAALGLCFWLLAQGCYRALRFVRGEGLRRLLARLVIAEPAPPSG